MKSNAPMKQQTINRQPTFGRIPVSTASWQGKQTSNLPIVAEDGDVVVPPCGRSRQCRLSLSGADQSAFDTFRNTPHRDAVRYSGE